jgi:Protein of unknown function (DUF2380)
LLNNPESAMYQLRRIFIVLAVLVMPSFSGLSFATGKCLAVFDFELIDMSLDGQINGIQTRETERLEQLTQQLRKWVTREGRLLSCNMAPVEVESKASNLFACGCIQRIARKVDARLAIVGSVHKLSNLILNIQIDVFDVDSDKLVAQLNADIRSNTDNSWTRGLDWLIQHRLGRTIAALTGGNK